MAVIYVPTLKVVCAEVALANWAMRPKPLCDHPMDSIGADAVVHLQFIFAVPSLVFLLSCFAVGVDFLLVLLVVSASLFFFIFLATLIVGAVVVPRAVKATVDPFASI